MGKYRKILVAYDGSGTGKNALKQALKLAREEQSWIKVLAVVPAYEGDLELVGVRNIKDVLRGPTEKLLREAAGIAAAEGAAIITDLEQGEAYERIVEIAESEHCDLIVMGRRGLRDLERAFMGSVTARVIGHSPSDVLVVPRGTSVSWESILLATDGSKYSLGATKKAVDFARSYKANLTAVSVVDVNEEFYAQAPEAVDKLIRRSRDILDEVKKTAEDSLVEVETFIKEGEAYAKIVELAAERKAGVIFVASHGKSGLMRLLMGSVTERVLGHAPCPVMVVGSQ